jgi:hypothetical protein
VAARTRAEHGRQAVGLPASLAAALDNADA